MTIMKKNIFLLAVTLLLIGFASCSDEDTKPIIPSDVIDLSADTQNKPGYIVLRWATPDDNTIRYIKVSYYDYLLEQDVVRLASVYAVSYTHLDVYKRQALASPAIKIAEPLDSNMLFSITTFPGVDTSKPRARQLPK